MDAVKSAKARLKKFPKLVLQCRELGAIYAACVTEKLHDVKKNDCLEEFNKFKDCLKKAAAQQKMRL